MVDAFRDGPDDLLRLRVDHDNAVAVRTNVKQVLLSIVIEAESAFRTHISGVLEEAEPAVLAICHQAVEECGDPQRATLVDGQTHHGVVRQTGVSAIVIDCPSVVSEAEQAPSVAAHPGTAPFRVAVGRSKARTVVPGIVTGTEAVCPKSEHRLRYDHQACLEGRDPEVALIVLDQVVHLPFIRMERNVGK